MLREREQFRMGDPRGFKDADQVGKRRAMEPSELEREEYHNSQRIRYQQSQHIPHIPAMDRLGGNAREQVTRERGDQPGNRPVNDAGRGGICFRCRQEGHH